MLKIRIRQHELGLCFRYGELYRVLQPGAYFIPGRLLGGVTVEVVETSKTRFEHPQLDVLLLNEGLRRELTVADLVDDQRAFVWVDGRLEFILGPGRHAF